jgi:hypothetical protein
MLIYLFSYLYFSDGTPSYFSLKSSSMKTVHQDGKAILGVAAMSGHVFIARLETPEIEMYSALSWAFQRYLTIPGLKTPTDIVVHYELGRLYVCDWSNTCVHFADVADAKGHTEVNGLIQSHSTDRSNLEEAPEMNGWSFDQGDSQKELAKEDRTKWSVDDSPWSMSLSQQGNSLLVICDQVRHSV